MLPRCPRLYWRPYLHSVHRTRPNGTVRQIRISASMARASGRTEFATEDEKQAYIAARIEASRKKRANQRYDYCPACKGGVGSRAKFMLHLRRCCKDLLTHHKCTHPDDPAKFQAFLTAIREKEAELKSRALFLRYMDPTRTRRRTVEEVAEAMELPLERTERLIKMAAKEIPLARDDVPVEVLYEDSALVAVQKPPFIITAPKHRFLGGTLFSRVYGYLDREPYGLHRLDMNTSGVVVFAKDAVSAEAVNAQFREKTVQKAYLAICLGVPRETEYVVETLIDADPDHEVAQRVTQTDGKWSKTSFRVLDSAPEIDLGETLTDRGAKFRSSDAVQGVCLLLCTPLTGRTHQIRLHTAHRGHAIIGDDIYGVSGPWIGRQALHAFRISFRHPTTQTERTVVAPPPNDFQKALDVLGLKLPESLL